MIQRCWPLYRRPVEGEALSSWLGRIANIYNLSLEDLLAYDLGYDISPHDLDLNPPHTLLKNIKERSKLSLDQIFHMTFKSWVPFIIDQLDPASDTFSTYVGQYPVLLPTKAQPSRLLNNWRPWLSHPPTIRGCQICIKSWPEIAFCLSWKLPVMVTCPFHGCRLQPCTSYSSNYVFWQEDQIMDKPVTKAVLKMDMRTWKALTDGKVELPCRSIHVGVWFRILRSLLNELSLPLSRYPGQSQHIRNIWNRCGYPIRAGLNIWKPYEYLPLQMQMKMLEAAATAMEMLEKGVLDITNEQSKLFQPELIDEDDYPSGYEPIKRNNEHHELTVGKTLTELFEQAVAEARVNRESAQGLRALYLLGRKDPEATREVDTIFLELGIPFRDL